MRRVAVPILTCALTGGLVLTAVASPASAAGSWGATTPRPGSGWGGSGGHSGGFGSRVGSGIVADNASTTSYGTDGDVTTSVYANGIVYLGGRFHSLLAPGGAATPAAGIAAVYAATGLPVPGFTGTTDDGEVLALAMSPDGTRLYVGGRFTHSNSAYAGHVMALNATTGARDTSWHASTTFPVHSLVASGTHVFAGGGTDFSVSGATSTYLASFDAATGSATAGWTPPLIDNEPFHTQAPAQTDGQISSLAVSSDGSRLFVGGYFNRVSGATRPALIALSTSTGALISTFTPLGLWGGTAHAGNDPLSLVSTPTHLYVAVGGQQNWLLDYNPVTGGKTRFFDRADGDFQAIALVGGRLYAGGHFHTYLVDTKGWHYNNMVLNGSVVDITFNARVDPVSGLLDPTWHPRMGNWQDAGAYFGTYTLATDGRNVYAGGAFDQASGVARPHVAVFAGQ